MKDIVGNKVVLIGAGDVGVAYAYALVNQGTCDHLAIIDIDEKKLEGNVKDLNHGVVWASSRTRVSKGTYADCADAAMVVICAGAAQKPGETRLQLVGKNMKIMKSIVDEVMSNGFDGIFLVASNPVDILTYAVWQYSGLDWHQVVGSGTVLDSNLEGELEKVFEETRDAAYNIIEAKGSTSYGIGMGLARITRAILQNQDVALPVSALLNGEYGEENIYIGTPAILYREGIRRVVELEISDHEMERFKHSAKVLREIQEEFFPAK